ncbi:MAG TPA: dihydrodipicolinate synthase family protein [Bryobacteraceae bacterium]|nr:dihydrodipicolinate synthase family protein [Bryobacteraceae bacterium]
MRNTKPFPLAGGVYTALATPRLDDAIEVDASALFDYLDTIMNAGVDGVVLFGSTGEFVHFDVAERMRTLALASKRCRIPLLVNVSHSTLGGALDLAENALDSCASGLLLMPPYFYRYNEAQIFEFYRQFAVALAGRMPIYLYNIPAFTNPIPAALAERLLSTGEFAGIKDSSGDWQLFESLQTLHANLPFRLLIGSDPLYFRARPLGADGMISGVGAAVPELVVALDRALAANDLGRAGRLNTFLDEFIAWINQFPATAGIKRAAAARGWKVNHSHTPFDEQTAATLRDFEQWFLAWLPAVLHA